MIVYGRIHIHMVLVVDVNPWNQAHGFCNGGYPMPLDHFFGNDAGGTGTILEGQLHPVGSDNDWDICLEVIAFLVLVKFYVVGYGVVTKSQQCQC